MTKDLEETLAELGPGYRGLVDRLVAAYQPQGRPGGASGEARFGFDECPAATSRGRVLGWTVGYLVAASLLVCLGVAALRPSPAASSALPPSARVYTAAYAADAAALTAIVASQRADGSWQNDFLTMQNAAALRRATDAAGVVAYKKAVRYLRTKGLMPLSDGELRVRGDLATRAMVAKG